MKTSIDAGARNHTFKEALRKCKLDARTVCTHRKRIRKRKCTWATRLKHVPVGNFESNSRAARIAEVDVGKGACRRRIIARDLDQPIHHATLILQKSLVAGTCRGVGRRTKIAGWCRTIMSNRR